MAMILNCSIDLSKIDKAKIIEGKAGAKYYNFDVVLNDEADKYGKDVAIKVSQTKEERVAKAKSVYIGNGKKVWEGQGKTQSIQPAQAAAKGTDSNLPF